MTEFVPSEFFAEDASAKEHKSHKKRRDQDYCCDESANLIN